MKFLSFTVLISIALTPATAQIATSKHNGVITGTWISKDSTNNMMLMLDSHGSGQLNGRAIKFVTHRHDKLHITEASVTTIYTYSLTDDLLTLSGGDLQTPISLARGSSAMHTTSSNTQDNSEHHIPKKLLGLWKGYEETIQFKPDAQCIYRDKIWPYIVSNDVITLQTPQGNFIMKYAIEGRNLHLTFGEADHVYTKEISVELVQTPEGKTLDLSIAGKWCFVLASLGTGKSTECMIFNPDGTYAYSTETSQNGSSNLKTSLYSDEGTWWLESNQIFFLTEKQGQGSYNFEKINHPESGEAMISFDGKTFVSASNHAPW
jgi:hypothetical protein